MQEKCGETVWLIVGFPLGIWQLCQHVRSGSHAVLIYFKAMDIYRGICAVSLVISRTTAKMILEILGEGFQVPLRYFKRFNIGHTNKQPAIYCSQA